MPDMKPNPCKWCGKDPEQSFFHKYYSCANMECVGQHPISVDFDTWQKNNPLPKVMGMNVVFDPAMKPNEVKIEYHHQFKVGDWVTEKGHKTKMQIEEIKPSNISSIFARDYWWLPEQLEPTTRLKRKEIKKIVKRLLKETVDGGDINIVEDGLNKLLEDI